MGTDGSGTQDGSVLREAFGPLSPTELRRLGRLAGALFLLGVACAIPASLALKPQPPTENYLLIAAGMLVALAAVAAPWRRMSPLWIHAVVVAGILQIALAVDLFSDDFNFYYVLVAAYVAYVVRDRRVLGAYFVLLTIALLAPLVHDDQNTREQAHHILVTLPALVIVAGLVLYLRDVLERRERRYRDFALEAVTLAIRIRGTHGGADRDATTDELDARLDELAAEAEGRLGRQTYE